MTYEPSVQYPDERAGPFEPPPGSFEDRKGRLIKIKEYESDFESLVEMYQDFRPEDRAQGIPPLKQEGIRSWLETLEKGINVLAWHQEKIVGHGTLVTDNNETYELGIFVLHEYQQAGIGYQLLEYLLGKGQKKGVSRVWLMVERWNKPAIHIYKKAGFEVCNSERTELEMSLKL